MIKRIRESSLLPVAPFEGLVAFLQWTTDNQLGSAPQAHSYHYSLSATRCARWQMTIAKSTMENGRLSRSLFASDKGLKYHLAGI
jgi:hypothetical protein